MAIPEKLAHLKIPLEDIRSATNNFADENLIREGGIGQIYKGKLERSGKSIAIVARWLNTKDWRGGKAFWTEIYLLASLKHKNLVSIVGFCNENDEMIIVNKHEAKGSLDKYLSDPTFTWTQRLQVCLGVARGLSFIHYDKQRSSSVIHSNLKSSKILLDENWEAKISGFEISKINPVARRYGLVLDREISGTYAYVDPAYIKTGGVTHKSDVYTLGVILFECMCGKKAFISDDRDEWDIHHLSKTLSNGGKLQEVFENKIPAHLGKQHSNEEVDVVMKPEIYLEEEGYSTHLTKQHSNERKLVEVVQEGNSSLLTKPHSNGSKLAETDENEGGSPQFPKPHSHEGKVGVVVKVDDIFENAHSASFVRELDYETRSIQSTIYQGGVANSSITSQNKLMRQVSYFIQGFSMEERGQLPLYSPHDNYAPSLSELIKPRNLSYTEEEYCDNDSYAGLSLKKNLSALYMTTARKLKQLQVPKEGLLSQLAESHYEARSLDDIIHPGLRVQMESESLKIFSEVAYCCLKEHRSQRPYIDRIIVALERALEHQLKRENSERSMVEAQGTSTSYLEGKDLEHLKIEHDAIVSATENFAEKYYIGSGGYGIVYEAKLEHFDFSATKGQKDSKMAKICNTVAIKSIFERDDTQGEEGFLLEIKTLSTCNHPNVISLLGFCYERPRMYLVYEHVSNGSLDNYLDGEGKMINLTWVQRIKICIDIARGLDYIHSTFLDKEKIIHRDVKSANILLNEKWEAKIADFGLSKVNATNETGSTLINVTPVGTGVYMDPEYKGTRNLKKESDVYSFGVVMFEILFGRLAYDKLYITENERGLHPLHDNTSRREL